MSELSRGRGKRPAAPRGRGRRTQAERDALTRAEQERNKARDEQFVKQQNLARLAQERTENSRRHREQNAGRGQGRGRGGFMADSARSGPQYSAIGPLAGGSVIRSNVASGKAYPRPWAPSGTTASGPGDDGVDQKEQRRTTNASSSGQHGTSSGGPSHGSGGGRSAAANNSMEFEYLDAGNTKALDAGYISSDMDEPERGARKPIEHISLLTDDEDEDGGRTFSGIPVRLTRFEHRDRVSAVTTEDGTRVKVEDDDMPMADAPTYSKGKGKQRQGSMKAHEERPWTGVWTDPNDRLIEEEPSQMRRPARPRALSNSAAQDDEDAARPIRRAVTGEEPQLFNEEERMEHARDLMDKQVMLDEFADPSQHQDATRTYIFQFPPILPTLKVDGPIYIKDDPETLTPLPPNAAPASSNKDAAIKVEEDAPTSKKDGFAEKFVRPTIASGAVGKLRVHKSGKVTMSWGGNLLTVSNGVNPTFLQSLVSVRMDAQTASGGLGTQGTATAFGQPRGKLIVQPDWDELFAGERLGKIKLEG